MAQERSIIVRCVFPPIPIRQFDWCAWRDGDEPNDNGNMRCGWGPTAAAAIDDLIQLEEDEHDLPR